MAGTGGACERCGMGLVPSPKLTDCVPPPAGNIAQYGLVLVCPDGMTPNNDKTFCRKMSGAVVATLGIPETCKPGYTPNPGRSACDFCPPRHHNTDGIDCKLCADGTKPDATRTKCVPCPAGQSGTKGRCDVCMIGQYSPQVGESKCTTCGPKTQPNAAKTGCEPCPEGYAGNFGICFKCNDGSQPDPQNNRRCAPCPPGSAGTDGKCDLCKAGTYTKLEGLSKCKACPDGFAPNDSNTLCVRCPLGYDATSGMNVCLKCASGLVSDPVRKTCEPCNDGMRGENGKCVECPEGFAGANSNCERCAPGMVPDGAKFECIECPAGFAGSNGTCAMCPPGTHAPAGSVSCKRCPDGSEVNPGRNGCRKCPPGKAGKEGFCETAPPGFVPSDTNTTFVKPLYGRAAIFGISRQCPDAHQLNADRTACEPCPPGLVGKGGECYPCQGGRRPNPDGTDCIQCPSNYAGNNGICTKCGDGYAPNDVMTACEPCGAGEAGRDGICLSCADGFEPAVTKTHCEPCKANSAGKKGKCGKCPDGFAPDPARGTCEKCGPGEAGSGGKCRRCQHGYQPSAQQTRCEPCPPGKYGHNGVCFPCADRYYAPTEALQECIRCPDGRRQSDDRSMCVQCPYSYAGIGGACVQCPDGSEVEPSDPSRCRKCEKGTAGLMGICQRCEAYTRANIKGMTRCTTCEPGTIVDKDSIECIPCADGSVSSDGKTCRQCEDGRMPNRENTDCEFCPPGFAGTKGFCEMCPQGYFAEGPGATECLRCPAGVFSIGLGAEKCEHPVEDVTGTKQPSVDVSPPIDVTAVVRSVLNPESSLPVTEKNARHWLEKEFGEDTGVQSITVNTTIVKDPAIADPIVVMNNIIVETTFVARFGGVSAAQVARQKFILMKYEALYRPDLSTCGKNATFDKNATFSKAAQQPAFLQEFFATDSGAGPLGALADEPKNSEAAGMNIALGEVQRRQTAGQVPGAQTQEEQEQQSPPVMKPSELLKISLRSAPERAVLVQMRIPQSMPATGFVQHLKQTRVVQRQIADGLYRPLMCLASEGAAPPLGFAHPESAGFHAGLCADPPDEPWPIETLTRLIQDGCFGSFIATDARYVAISLESGPNDMQTYSVAFAKDMDQAKSSMLTSADPDCNFPTANMMVGARTDSGARLDYFGANDKPFQQPDLHSYAVYDLGETPKIPTINIPQNAGSVDSHYADTLKKSFMRFFSLWTMDMVRIRSLVVSSDPTTAQDPSAEGLPDGHAAWLVDVTVEIQAMHKPGYANTEFIEDVFARIGMNREENVESFRGLLDRTFDSAYRHSGGQAPVMRYSTPPDVLKTEVVLKCRTGNFMTKNQATKEDMCMPCKKDVVRCKKWGFAQSECSAEMPYTICEECRRGFVFSRKSGRCEPEECGCENAAGNGTDPGNWTTTYNLTRFPFDDLDKGIVSDLELMRVMRLIVEKDSPKICTNATRNYCYSDKPIVLNADGTAQIKRCAAGFYYVPVEGVKNMGTCKPQKCSCANSASEFQSWTSGDPHGACEQWKKYRCPLPTTPDEERDFCLTGYDYSTQRQVCEIRVCVCSDPGGTPATGAQCPLAGAERCASCGPGKSVSKGQCIPNDCICSSGTAVPSAKCESYGMHSCEKCLPTHELDPDTNTCVEKTCECPNGEPAIGCKASGGISCRFCDRGYSLVEKNVPVVASTTGQQRKAFVCQANQCFCANGNTTQWQSAGDDICPHNGMTCCKMNDCKPGYTYDVVSKLCAEAPQPMDNTHTTTSMTYDQAVAAAGANPFLVTKKQAGTSGEVVQQEQQMPILVNQKQETSKNPAPEDQAENENQEYYHMVPPDVTNKWGYHQVDGDWEPNTCFCETKNMYWRTESATSRLCHTHFSKQCQDEEPKHESTGARTSAASPVSDGISLSETHRALLHGVEERSSRHHGPRSRSVKEKQFSKKYMEDFVKKYHIEEKDAASAIAAAAGGSPIAVGSNQAKSKIARPGISAMGSFLKPALSFFQEEISRHHNHCLAGFHSPQDVATSPESEEGHDETPECLPNRCLCPHGKPEEWLTSAEHVCVAHGGHSCRRGLTAGKVSEFCAEGYEYVDDEGTTYSEDASLILISDDPEEVEKRKQKGEENKRTAGGSCVPTRLPPSTAEVDPAASSCQCTYEGIPAGLPSTDKHCTVPNEEKCEECFVGFRRDVQTRQCVPDTCPPGSCQEDEICRPLFSAGGFTYECQVPFVDDPCLNVDCSLTDNMGQLTEGVCEVVDATEHVCVCAARQETHAFLPTQPELYTCAQGKNDCAPGWTGQVDLALQSPACSLSVCGDECGDRGTCVGGTKSEPQCECHDPRRQGLPGDCRACKSGFNRVALHLSSVEGEETDVCVDPCEQMDCGSEGYCESESASGDVAAVDRAYVGVCVSPKRPAALAKPEPTSASPSEDVVARESLSHLSSSSVDCGTSPDWVGIGTTPSRGRSTCARVVKSLFPVDQRRADRICREEYDAVLATPAEEKILLSVGEAAAKWETQRRGFACARSNPTEKTALENKASEVVTLESLALEMRLSSEDLGQAELENATRRNREARETLKDITHNPSVQDVIVAAVTSCISDTVVAGAGWRQSQSSAEDTESGSTDASSDVYIDGPSVGNPENFDAYCDANVRMTLGEAERACSDGESNCVMLHDAGCVQEERSSSLAREPVWSLCSTIPPRSHHAGQELHGCTKIKVKRKDVIARRNDAVATWIEASEERESRTKPIPATPGTTSFRHSVGNCGRKRDDGHGFLPITDFQLQHLTEGETDLKKSLDERIGNCARICATDPDCVAFDLGMLVQKNGGSSDDAAKCLFFGEQKQNRASEGESAASQTTSVLARSISTRTSLIRHTIAGDARDQRRLCLVETGRWQAVAAVEDENANLNGQEQSKHRNGLQLWLSRKQIAGTATSGRGRKAGKIKASNPFSVARGSSHADLATAAIKQSRWRKECSTSTRELSAVKLLYRIRRDLLHGDVLSPALAHRLRLEHVTRSRSSRRGSSSSTGKQRPAIVQTRGAAATAKKQTHDPYGRVCGVDPGAEC
ncbi:unnamed protein product [Amoebophrya sp. A120]|nr:unnamed protein product [Amoebophrya sp. A120]|eukprot:GSA120T00018497001.1